MIEVKNSFAIVIFLQEYFKRTVMKNKKDKNTEGTKCESPQTRSISEKVHEHLRNKNDHISDADIRNAVINPDENELEIKDENAPQKNVENTKLNDTEQEKNKTVTPWDVV